VRATTRTGTDAAVTHLWQEQLIVDCSYWFWDEFDLPRILNLDWEDHAAAYTAVEAGRRAAM
jgi:hypothetical protein